MLSYHQRDKGKLIYNKIIIIEALFELRAWNG